MQPSGIPDTRNYEWSPRKNNARQQSGELLYFISGFLSLQLELQNFVSSTGLGTHSLTHSPTHSPTHS